MYSKIETQKESLKKKLLDYYSDKSKLEIVSNLVNESTYEGRKMSLRLIEWGISNYAKQHYVVYELDKPDVRGNIEKVRFKLHDNYRLKLNGYHKDQFDPCCRSERINIPFDENSFMETTLGQLNFFHWAIENKVLDYIKDNYDEISADMKLRSKSSLKKSKEGTTTSQSDNKTRKKREELSVSACKCIKKEMVKIIVKFN